MSVAGVVEILDHKEITEPEIVRMDDHPAQRWEEDSERLSELLTLASESVQYPLEFGLGFLLDRRLRPQEPLSIRVTREAEKFVAEAPEINEFGFGATFHEALKDLQRVVAELFLELRDKQDRLGPDLAAVWAELNRKYKFDSP